MNTAVLITSEIDLDNTLLMFCNQVGWCHVAGLVASLTEKRLQLLVGWAWIEKYSQSIKFMSFKLVV